MTDDALERRRAELAISERRIALEEKQAELAIQLAQYGLKSTLFGTFAGFLFVLLLALLGYIAPEMGITGTHIVIMIAIMGSIVGIYGAFVFNRSASIAAKIGEHTFTAATTRSGEAARDT